MNKPHRHSIRCIEVVEKDGREQAVCKRDLARHEEQFSFPEAVRRVSAIQIRPKRDTKYVLFEIARTGGRIEMKWDPETKREVPTGQMVGHVPVNVYITTYDPVSGDYASTSYRERATRFSRSEALAAAPRIEASIAAYYAGRGQHDHPRRHVKIHIRPTTGGEEVSR